MLNLKRKIEMVVVLSSFAKSKQKHLISSREFPFWGVRLDHMVEISSLSIKFGYEFIHEFKLLTMVTLLFAEF